MKSLEVRGYNLDKPFSENEHEYNVTVTEDEIQIVCDAKETIEGCNVTINLKDKKQYTHQIILDNNGKKQIYTITINKTVLEEDSELRITSIEGNPLEWTNENVDIKVNAESPNGIESYSFDGGNTWQISNVKSVTENQILQVVVKDKKGNITQAKEVNVDRIDKEQPTVKVEIEKSTKNQITLKVLSNDNLSGIDVVSFNNSNYENKDIFTVTKTGIYYASVKDKAGNVSEKATIEIKNSDFVEETKETEKTFTATFNGNGATSSKSYISCTTTKDSCEIKTPAITRNGSTILGWSTDANATSAAYGVDKTIKLTKDETYYAITYKTVSARFYANGSTISSTLEQCKIYNNNSSCSIKTPTIVRAGWNLIGWGLNANQTSTNIKSNSTISIKGNTKYYAITSKTLKATFDKNSADSIGSTSLSCKLYGTATSCSVTAPTITRSGWTVVGWNTSSSGTTASNNVGSAITLKSNATYYAITSKTLKATFNKNGANSIGSTSLSCNLYNSETSCTVTAPTITRSGWTIVGWNTSNTATTANCRVEKTLTLKSNATYYAITSKSVAAYFIKNGSDSVGSESLRCNLYNTSTSCSVTAPTITRSGWTIVGWNTSNTATTASYKVGSTISVSSSTFYYAITKKTVTATFDSSVSSKSCTRYNNESCTITLPTFNKTGKFNGAWGTNKSNPDPTYKVGTTMTLTDNINLYASIKHPWGDNGYNYTKTRNLTVSKSTTIGNMIFEYQSGIPTSAINSHISFLNTVYSTLPFLFVPGKTFVLTYDTYTNYSFAYGLTHFGGSYVFIDLKYDSKGDVVKNAIDQNATIHEMAHAWDFYYSFKTGKGYLRDQSDFVSFYNQISSKLYVDDNNQKLSKTETFAAMVTNYYWHILGKDTSKVYYGLKSGYTLSASEKNTLKTIMEKYIKISNNNYK